MGVAAALFIGIRGTHSVMQDFEMLFLFEVVRALWKQAVEGWE